MGHDQYPKPGEVDRLYGCPLTSLRRAYRLSLMARMILRKLRDADIAQIRQWPVYPGDMFQMDYALRSQGWLDAFRTKPDVAIFVAQEGNELIGFSLLIKTGTAEAEFRIALRADKTGQGRGETIASLTLQKGFAELGLSRVHLIVRKNNSRGIRLYQRLGFIDCGACWREIRGVLVDFMMMAIGSGQFARSRKKRKGENHDKEYAQGFNRH